MFNALRCCRILTLLPVLSLALLPVGCGKEEASVNGSNSEVETETDNGPVVSQAEPNKIDSAIELMTAGKNDQAIDLLAAGDIEKSFRESSLQMTQISEKDFMALSSNERGRLQKEMLPSVGLLRGAAYKQIEEMKELQSKGLSKEADIIKANIQRLIDLLKDGEHLLIFEGLGKGIGYKLNEATGEK